MVPNRRFLAHGHFSAALPGFALCFLLASTARAAPYERVIEAKKITRLLVGLTSGDVTVRGWDKDQIKLISKDKDGPQIEVRATEVHIGGDRGGPLQEKIFRKFQQELDKLERKIERRKKKLERAKKRAEQRDSDPPPDLEEVIQQQVVTQIRQKLAGQRFGGGADADITLWVPRRLGLAVQTASGGVKVRDMKGRLQIVTVSGDVAVEHTAGTLNIETVSGDVELRQHNADLALKTVSGTITVKQLKTLVLEANLVSGQLIIDAAKTRTARLSSQSGDLQFSGQLAQDGSLSANTFSGEVTIALPRTAAFELQARSHSGDITVKRAVQYAERGEHRVRAQASQGGPLVRVNSFSGDVLIK